MEGEIIMDQKIIDLYNDYSRGLLDRRDFIKKLVIITGSAAAADAIFLQLENKYANAEVTKEDDPEIHGENIKYEGETGEINAYLAKPKTDEKLTRCYRDT